MTKDSSGSKFHNVGEDFSPQQRKHTDTNTNISNTDQTQHEHLNAPMKTFDNSLPDLGYKFLVDSQFSSYI